MIESDTERLLRESLHRRAERAPDGAQLAERILATAGASSDRVVHRSFRWQTWVTPLVSAAAVAAVAVAVVKAPSGHHSGSPSAEGAKGRAPSASVQNQPQRSPRVMPAPARTSAGSPAADSSAPVPPAAGSSAAGSSVSTGAAVSGFQASDLTFVSNTMGWAIGTARCLDGSAGRCPAMMHTTDGRTWTAMPPPPIQRGHEQLGIRFANGRIGYAYDPSVLFMTTDGGRSWQRQSGGALALETLDGNVVRLVSPHTGCPGPCDVRLQTAPLGSSTWSTVPSGSGRIDAAAVQLARAGQEVYVLVKQHAGASTLITVSDTGSGWRADGDPCAGTPAVGVAVAAAPNRRVAVLCRSATGSGERLAVSSDAGAHFSLTAGTLPIGADLLAGDSRAVLLAGGTDGVYRSADGGASWARVPGLGAVQFVGFESAAVGRAVSADGGTIWTTTDGGASWQATRFP